MTSFPLPSRAAIEGPNDLRTGVYVLSTDLDCVWIHGSAAAALKAGEVVRLTFRKQGRASLGVSGKIVRGHLDTMGVRLDGPIARAILAAWALDDPADISPSQRVFTSETPTADVSARIAGSKTELLRPRRFRKQDTLDDFVVHQTHA